MHFVTVNTTEYGKMTINVNNIVQFYVSHPREDKVLTRIDTTLHGYPLFVEKDISRDLVMAIRSNEGFVTVIN